MKNHIVTVDRRGMRQRWVLENENNEQNVRHGRRSVRQHASPRPLALPSRRAVRQRTSPRPSRVVRRRVQQNRPSVFANQFDRFQPRNTANGRMERYRQRQRQKILWEERQSRHQRETENIARNMMPTICIPNLSKSQIENIQQNLLNRAQNVANIENAVEDDDNWAPSFAWLFGHEIYGIIGLAEGNLKKNYKLIKLRTIDYFVVKTIDGLYKNWH